MIVSKIGYPARMHHGWLDNLIRPVHEQLALSVLAVSTSVRFFDERKTDVFRQAEPAAVSFSKLTTNQILTRFNVFGKN